MEEEKALEIDLRNYIQSYLDDDRFDAIVRFNFVSTNEKDKVKNLSVGDAVVIEIKYNDSCELYDCHIVS